MIFLDENYAEAPEDVRTRVASLGRVCAANGVALPAAALQFPLAHPQVASVIPGTRTPEEFAQLLAWRDTQIPAALWSDLKAEGPTALERFQGTTEQRRWFHDALRDALGDDLPRRLVAEIDALTAELLEHLGGGGPPR